MAAKNGESRCKPPSLLALLLNPNSLHSEFQDTPLEIPLGPQGSRPALKHANNDGGMSFFEKLGLTGGHSSMGSIPAVSFEVSQLLWL